MFLTEALFCDAEGVCGGNAGFTSLDSFSHRSQEFMLEDSDETDWPSV